MNAEAIIKIFDENGVKPATKRKLSLLTFSLIMNAYDAPLKKFVGFSYQIGAAIGNKNGFQCFFNEEYIADQTEALLRDKTKIKELTDKAKAIFDNAKQKIKLDRNNKENSLESVVDIYQKYFVSIAIYNCFWRYLNKNASGLSTETIENIGKERHTIAQFYPELEKIMGHYALQTGKKNSFDGDLLRFMTKKELQSFWKNKKTLKTKIKELQARRGSYFYLFFDGEEKVFTDKKTIQKIKAFFGSEAEEEKNLEKYSADLIKGNTAHPGLVKGLVYIHLPNKPIKMKENFILVTPMTHPDDTMLISKCSAIVTDEGGVLCHAAIMAREMKKPCIVGTKIATKVLKDGDKVEVDAEKGIVRKIG